MGISRIIGSDDAVNIHLLSVGGRFSVVDGPCVSVCGGALVRSILGVHLASSSQLHIKRRRS